MWASRERNELFTALASWQLLLDERILESAGTPGRRWPDDRLVAALNLPIFVRGAFSAHPQFDESAFEAVAGLAVRALDDALLLARNARAPAPRLRIGMIGLADALLMLGLPYGAEAARRQAGVFARALAQGCLRGTVRLAAERGGQPDWTQQTLRRARLRGIAEPLLEETALHGVRHAGLTAITAQPRLALLANNVADALEPLPGANHVRHVASHGQDRAIRSSGYALTLLRRMQPLRAGAMPRGHGSDGAAASAAGDARRGAAVDRRAVRVPAGAGRTGPDALSAPLASAPLRSAAAPGRASAAAPR